MSLPLFQLNQVPFSPSIFLPSIINPIQKLNIKRSLYNLAVVYYNNYYSHCCVYPSITKLLGIKDSSGIEFFYLSEPRAEEAGIITLGHHVNNAMIIPPRTSRHNIFGKCGGVCTSQVRIKLNNNYCHSLRYNLSIINGGLQTIFL